MSYLVGTALYRKSTTQELIMGLDGYHVGIVVKTHNTQLQVIHIGIVSKHLLVVQASLDKYLQGNVLVDHAMLEQHAITLIIKMMAQTVKQTFYAVIECMLRDSAIDVHMFNEVKTCIDDDLMSGEQLDMLMDGRVHELMDQVNIH